MATLDELESLLGDTPKGAVVSAEEEPESGFLPAVMRPFTEVGGYLGKTAARLTMTPEERKYAGLETAPPVPIGGLAQLATLLIPGMQGFGLRSMLGAGVGSAAGGPTGEMVGSLLGGFASPALLRKASSLGKLPISQLFKKAAPAEEALAATVTGESPSINEALVNAANTAKGKMEAELVSPVASAGPASAAKATAGSQEATNFINLIRQNPDLRHTLFQPEALQDLMSKVIPLFQRGETAQNVFSQLYGRGPAVKEAVTSAARQSSEFTRFMEMAKGKLGVLTGETPEKIQTAAHTLAGQGKSAEDIYKMIFKTDAPGSPLVGGVR